MKDRVTNDHYPTPEGVTNALLDMLDARGFRLQGANVFDPSAGEGAILDVCAARGACGSGIEIEPDMAMVSCAKGHSVREGDALQCEWSTYDLLIMNPPFSLANEFAERAAHWAHQHKRVACALLRLSFFESTKGRAALHTVFPADVHVLHPRPRFRSDTKGSDNSTVAWWVWRHDSVGGRWRPMSWKKEEAA